MFSVNLVSLSLSHTHKYVHAVTRDVMRETAPDSSGMGIVIQVPPLIVIRFQVVEQLFV